MTLDQTARDLVRTILELQEQRAPEYIIVGTVRRVLAAERVRCAEECETAANGYSYANEPTREAAAVYCAAAIRALP